MLLLLIIILTDKALQYEKDIILVCLEIFTDGSSFVRDGKRKAGYAVVTAKHVLEAKSLPQGTSAQFAEL